MRFFGDIEMYEQDLLQSLGLLYLGLILHQKSLKRESKQEQVDFKTLIIDDELKIRQEER
jgi:hypothetical protein